MKKLLSILIALVVTLALVAVPVIANGDSTVNTGAVVGGGGSPPYVCCKFETPDHDPDASGTQVLPIADDSRQMKFYVVCGDTNGVGDIAAVDVTVRYPDIPPWYGQEKFQLRAIKGTASWVQLFWDDMIDMDGDCSGDTAMSEALPDLDAQGRISYGVVPGNPPIQMDLDKVLYDLRYGKQIMLELVGYMDCHQPSVDYTVEATATDAGGSTSPPVINTFFYMSIVAMQIDFETEGIQWAGVNVNQWNYLLGDEDMGTPARPTIKNIGNDPAMLMLHATALTGEVNGKTIEEFDAEMDEKEPESGNIIHFGRIEFPACETWIITEGDGSDSPAQTTPIKLVPCHPTQLDFSVHPPTGTIEDTYVGSMTLTILHYEPSVVNPYTPP